MTCFTSISADIKSARLKLQFKTFSSTHFTESKYKQHRFTDWKGFISEHPGVGGIIKSIEYKCEVFQDLNKCTFNS